MNEQEIRADERRRIVDNLNARAQAIEDSAGGNNDWLAQELFDNLPTLAIGGAVQADPRTVAIQAYRSVAFIITAESGESLA